MSFRHELFPDYKANRRGGPIVRKSSRPPVERRALGETPEFSFFFTLPDDLGFAVAPGPVAGIVGCEVGPSGTVTVQGRFAKDQILDKAARFLRTIAPPGYRRAIAGNLTRIGLYGASGMPAVEPLTIEISSGDPVVVISKAASRPLVVGGPKR